ncbi:MAG: hypothetical protein M1835_008014 [Candelina submexicana]|nr:MAG: hypothetical protein M1835_008014 [Candelina submexicana]
MTNNLDLELGAAISAGANGDQPKPVFLPEDDADADAFELFVTWLYRGTVSPVRKSEDQSAAFKLVARYLRLYIFADTIRISELKNTAMDRILESYQLNNTVPGRQDVKRIYGSTPAGSALRRFASRAVSWKLQRFGEWFDNKPSMAETIGELPEFAMDLITLLQSRELIPDPRKSNKSEFHDHAVGAGSSSSEGVVHGAPESS